MRALRVLRVVGALALAVGAFCAVGTPAASAGLLSCGAAAHPFAQFGDDGSYFLVSNGDFESGSSGWTLSGGARVVGGNEPFEASGPGTSSLSLPAGSSALGPKTCVALLTPHARMFVNAGPGAPDLHVQVVFYGLLGNVTGLFNYTTMDSADYQDWGPSAYCPSSLALPLFTAYARIKVSVGSGSGSWRVDDVYEDPWLSGI